MSDTTTRPFAVPARAASRAIVALAIGAFGIGIAEFTVTGLLGDIATGLGATAAQMGTAISVYALGVVVGAPLITVAGARLSKKSLLILAMSVFVLGNLAALLAPTIGLFTATRFVAGIPHGAYLGIAAATAVSLIDREKRGRASAQVVLGQTLANVLGVPAAIFLGQTLGWRAALGLVVAAGVATLVAVLLFVPSTAATSRPGVRATSRQLRSGSLWSGVVVAGAGFIGFFCVFSFITPITTEVAALPSSIMPLVLMAFGVGMTVGAIVGGRLADWSISRAVPLSFGIAAVVLVLGAVVMPAQWAPFFLAFAIGATTQLLVPSLQLRLMDAIPSAPALAASLNPGSDQRGQRHRHLDRLRPRGDRRGLSRARVRRGSLRRPRARPRARPPS